MHVFLIVKPSHQNLFEGAEEFENSKIPQTKSELESSTIAILRQFGGQTCFFVGLEIYPLLTSR